MFLLFTAIQNNKMLSSQVLAALGVLSYSLELSLRLKILSFPIFSSILQRGTVNEFWHIGYTPNHWNYYFYLCSSILYLASKSHFRLEFRSFLHSLLSELLSTWQTILGSSHKTPVSTLESITPLKELCFLLVTDYIWCCKCSLWRF